MSNDAEVKNCLNVLYDKEMKRELSVVKELMIEKDNLRKWYSRLLEVADKLDVENELLTKGTAELVTNNIKAVEKFNKLKNENQENIEVVECLDQENKHYINLIEKQENEIAKLKHLLKVKDNEQ